jgi:cytochrome c peroxidase
VLGAVGWAPSVADSLITDAAQRAQVVAHGPWPPPTRPDPSNRVSGQPAAVLLGERLFHSARLSTVGGLRCASCHEPWRSFTDGRAKALGAEAGSRNTQSLWNVTQNRWFGWDGASDALWAQSVRPMLDAREMRATPEHVARLMRDDAELAALYARALGAGPPDDDEMVLVGVAKALAAYQETLVSARTAFDDFRDAVEHGDAAAAARYPVAARRGLLLFVGRAGCTGCHSGAAFSDGHFHRSLIVSVRSDGRPDTGRQAGLEGLQHSPYRRAGRFSDAADGTTAHTAAPHDANMIGAFRTPGLREVAATAPYMHDGSVGNLCDAVRPHALDASADGAAAAPLSEAERRDLVAFLRSLSASADSGLVDPAVFRCR